MQVRNVNIARENRGLAQNKPRVVESVHVMNPHISGKVVKRTTWISRRVDQRWYTSSRVECNFYLFSCTLFVL